MADTLTALLPGGWTRLSGGPKFDITRTGRDGAWDINQYDPNAVWELNISYAREDYEGATGEKFDQIYNFFLITGAAFEFNVDDLFDNTAVARGGQGHVEEILPGRFALVKHYRFGPLIYRHPIARPKSDVVLGGGAANGTLDPATGFVSGINSPGTWTGGFYRPMIFLSSKFAYETGPDGIVRSIDVPLQEALKFEVAQQ